MGSIVDLSILKALVGGDELIIQEILQDYRVSSHQMAIDLRAAQIVGDFQLVADIANKLKSSSRSIGALAFGDLCTQIENAGKATDGAAIQICLIEFDRTLVSILAHLDAILETTNTAQT